MGQLVGVTIVYPLAPVRKNLSLPEFGRGTFLGNIWYNFLQSMRVQGWELGYTVHGQYLVRLIVFSSDNCSHINFGRPIRITSGRVRGDVFRQIRTTAGAAAVLDDFTALAELPL